MEFVEFPKIARLSRDVVVTEKIDGTNAQVLVAKKADVDTASWATPWLATVGDLVIAAGSRSRYIVPAADNHGWAAWVLSHADELAQLGEGRHYGEWWGSGIQRGYGLTNGEKRFSLFNVARWADDRDREKFTTDRPACCGVVPVLHRGEFDTWLINGLLQTMRAQGSRVVPGFMKPEGIVIFHTASGQLFKKTLEKDEEPKSKVA